MVYELTEPLILSIERAMENQEQTFALDASAGALVSVDGGRSVDEETLYTLPSWDSRDGFQMLEAFVSSLHADSAHEELRQVLISGRGVFRNFKNVIRKYPNIERRWHFFKDKQMRERIMDWYNTLRGVWGLEALDQDFEEYDDLTEEDFTFSEYNPGNDGDCIAINAGVLADEIRNTSPGELGQALAFLWKSRNPSISPEQKRGFICRSITSEFAGCLLVSPCPSEAKETVVVTDFFVVQNYRGLGIARELLSLCLPYLKEHGIHWCIIPAALIPAFLEPLVSRWGFRKTDSGFVADFTEGTPGE